MELNVYIYIYIYIYMQVFIVCSYLYLLQSFVLLFGKRIFYTRSYRTK